MASTQVKIPTTQSALHWVRVTDENPFEWTTTAPVVRPEQLGDQQVLLENFSSSLNPIDYKLPKPSMNFANTILPASVGFDISGRVVAIGKGVERFQIGDEVFGYLNLNSSHGGGAFQQFTVADIDGLVKKPANVSHEYAGALGVAFLSAMDGLRQVKIDSSTTVFVPGGSGGVGHYIVQIARILGAKRIITSASKAEGIRTLKEIYHVDEVIDHSKENIVERVLELTDGKGADIVYDATYLPSSMEKSIQTVREGGSWIVLGHFGAQGSEQSKLVAERKANLVHADLGRYWFGPQRSQFESLVREPLTKAAQWIGEGLLKPYINQTIELKDVQETLKKLEQGKTAFGKVVVRFH